MKITEYDQIRSLINQVRDVNKKLIREQLENEQPIENNTQPTNTSSDINVINNVEVKINSDDKLDLSLNDDEKGKISQLIDDFRQEVSETVEFGTFEIYDNSGKLNGKISNTAIEFILSGGDDQGVYINSSMLKLDDDTFSMLTKLKTFEGKFITTVNELIVNRKGN